MPGAVCCVCALAHSYTLEVEHAQCNLVALATPSRDAGHCTSARRRRLLDKSVKWTLSCVRKMQGKRQPCRKLFLRFPEMALSECCARVCVLAKVHRGTTPCAGWEVCVNCDGLETSAPWCIAASSVLGRKLADGVGNGGCHKQTRLQAPLRCFRHRVDGCRENQAGCGPGAPFQR